MPETSVEARGPPVRGCTRWEQVCSALLDLSLMSSICIWNVMYPFAGFPVFFAELAGKLRRKADQDLGASDTVLLPHAGGKDEPLLDHAGHGAGGYFEV